MSILICAFLIFDAKFFLINLIFIKFNGFVLNYKWLYQLISVWSTSHRFKCFYFGLTRVAFASVGCLSSCFYLLKVVWVSLLIVLETRDVYLFVLISFSSFQILFRMQCLKVECNNNVSCMQYFIVSLNSDMVLRVWHLSFCFASDGGIVI